MDRTAIVPGDMQTYYDDWKMSPGLACGDFVFLTGFTGADPSGRMSADPEAQMRNAFRKVERVLTEAGLLPGALQKNAGLKFINDWQMLQVTSTNSVLTSAAEVGQALNIPINHFEGNYTCSPETLAELQANDQIVLTYVPNPNGSVGDIAGVCNEGRNVVGLMPHPERASHDLLGSTDGNVLLQSVLDSVAVSA